MFFVRLFMIIIKKTVRNTFVSLYFSLFKAKPVNVNIIYDHADRIKRGSCMNIYEI